MFPNLGGPLVSQYQCWQGEVEGRKKLRSHVHVAGLAQLVERWSHNPKVVSSILTPGTFFDSFNAW
jgi:hypothetical protein